MELSARHDARPITLPEAEALYRFTEVGDQIPAKLYAVVAELLAFVYRTQQRTAGKAGA